MWCKQMNVSNNEINIRGKVYSLSQMSEDQLDLNERASRLLKSAKEKYMQAEDDEAAAKYYIEKLEQDLKANYKDSGQNIQTNNNVDNNNNDDIVFLTMR